MGRRLRKNSWVGERNRKKPKTSKTSPFLWQTEKEWWMGSKGISKPWKILLTDFIARHDEKSEVWKGTGSAAAELNSFEASGEVTHCPKTLIGVISHAKGLRSEVCILMFIMEWMLWLFLSKQPFFFPPQKWSWDWDIISTPAFDPRGLTWPFVSALCEVLKNEQKMLLTFSWEVWSAVRWAPNNNFL